MTTRRRTLRLFLVTLGLCLTLAPARGTPPALRPDPALQAAATALLGSRVGVLIVYDMPARRVLVATDAPLAFEALRPPGSLMKLVTAVAIYPDRARVVRCANRHDVGGRTFTCGVEGGHGPVDLRAAIARSCCGWFQAVGRSLSPSALLATARRLGLGRPSPFPAGVPARLRTPATARERAEAEVGEGRCVSITPWDAISLVVSLHDATDDAGRFVFAAMRDVVTNGTGQDAALTGVDVHGKTGTAEWLGDAGRRDAPPRTHGWFAGTAGRLAFVVFLQNGTGRDAAAIAGRLLRACRRVL